MFGLPISLRELQPFLDGEVRVGLAPGARRELLQGGGQDAEAHRPGPELARLRLRRGHE